MRTYAMPGPLCDAVSQPKNIPAAVRMHSTSGCSVLLGTDIHIRNQPKWRRPVTTARPEGAFASWGASRVLGRKKNDVYLRQAMGMILRHDDGRALRPLLTDCHWFALSCSVLELRSHNLLDINRL